MVQYLVAAAALAVYLVLDWLLGNVLNLGGASLWIFRIGFALIGIAAVAVFFWFREKTARDKNGAFRAGPGSDSTDPIHNELDEIFREAESRLRSAQLARGLSLRNLPTFYVIGDADSAKTSSIIHSGLDPTLLAGQVYQDTTVRPTHSANLWFVRNALIIDAGSYIFSGTAGWLKLLRLLQPRRLDILRGRQAQRAAVLCISCDQLLAGGTETISGSVRNIRSRLEEMGRQFGIRFPVYVLFTKLDRLPFFQEFTRNLTGDEASDVLGVTLPRIADRSGGVFAEEQTRLLNSTFNNLFLSLCEKRMDLLHRENDPNVVGGIYEFPRELRKLRSLIVQLLVDVGRPSPLGGGPFVRGFYFSGVRPVIVDELATTGASHRAEPRSTFVRPSDATSIFNVDTARATPGFSAPGNRSSKRVPQWTFLGHLFTDVILRDSVALSTSGSSTKTNAVRRAFMASVAIVAILLCIAFTVSFVENQSYQSKISKAVANLQQIPVSVVPSLDQMKGLEKLREPLEELAIYNNKGHSFFYLGWGLYSGDELYDAASRLYFERFRQALLAPTQKALLDSLRRLPSAPKETDDLQSTYDVLKAYLITTSNHAESRREFLSQRLLKSSSVGQMNDTDELKKLAGLQFDFYSYELHYVDPYATVPDSTVQERPEVGHARQYLGTFPIYQAKLAAVSEKTEAVNFNRRYSSDLVKFLKNDYEVKGAFTVKGWGLMQDEIRKADQAGEDWVLGAQNSPPIDPAEQLKQLQNTYTKSYISEWQKFIQNGIVVTYGGIPDAADKLKEHSGDRSPILVMLCMVSENTVVDPAVKKAFESVQSFVPPQQCREQHYKGDSNQPYVSSLVDLFTSLELLSKTSPGPERDQLANDARTKVSPAALSITRKLPLDSSVKTLLEKPITNLENVLKNVGQTDLNGKGQDFCRLFRGVTSKYPFKASSKVRATLDEVSNLFQPKDGAMWVFYEASLKDHIVQLNGKYGSRPGDAVMINQSFQDFWNNAVTFSKAVYQDQRQPRLSFGLRVHQIEGYQSLKLSIDGQSVTASEPNSPFQRFEWTGRESRVRVTDGLVTERTILSFDGIWAVFELFSNDDAVWTDGTYPIVKWAFGNGPLGKLAVGNPQTFSFELDMGGAPLVFSRRFLNGLNCVENIAH